MSCTDRNMINTKTYWQPAHFEMSDAHESNESWIRAPAPNNLKGTEYKEKTARWCHIILLQVTIKHTDYPHSQDSTQLHHVCYIIPACINNKTVKEMKWVNSWQLTASISLLLTLQLCWAVTVLRDRGDDTTHTYSFWSTSWLIPLKRCQGEWERRMCWKLQHFPSLVPHTLAYNYIIVNWFLSWVADGKHKLTREEDCKINMILPLWK